MRKILFAVALMCPTLAISQLSVDFSADQIPEGCYGTKDKFVVSDGALHSSNEVAGESYLFSPSTAMDGAEWKLSVDMPEPNGSAFVRYYLAYDSPSPEKEGSGYFLRVGDAKRLITFCYQKPTGSTTTLAKSDSLRLTAPEGTKSLHVDVKVKRSAKGVWKIYSKLSGEKSFKEEFSVTDLTVTESSYSGVYCKYPKTKANDFTFDDWIVTGKAVEDVTPPVLQSYALTDSTFSCLFSEMINLERLSYELPASFEEKPLLNAKGNTLTFSLREPWDEGARYEVKLLGCADLSGNQMDTVIVFGLPTVAEKGDLLFTEIMFAPATGNSEFVEVVNHSDKVLDLSDLAFSTRKKDAERTLGKRLVAKQTLIFPGEYKVITKKKEGVCGDLQCPDENAFLVTSSLAAMNNSGGWVTLSRCADSTVIEEVYYDPQFHVEGVPNKGTGVSLERVSLDEDLWTSASPSTGYASPGLENQAMMGVDDLSFEADEICYPYLDEAGVWHLRYELDQAGYSANVKVFSVAGVQVATIAQRLPLSVVGELSWDGRSDGGALLPVAPYVVVMDLIHPSGIHLNRHFVVLISR